MNTTPLRLVAIEEGTPEEGEQSGTPVAMMGEQDAITRRVPESDMIATMAKSVDRRRRFPGLKILLSAGGVAAVVLVFVVAFALKGRSAANLAPINTTRAPVPSPERAPQLQPSAPPAAPAAASALRINAAPEFIHLTVTAQPVESELSLDGNVLAGHHLNLSVPRDRGIHVVSASAPGYLPFNQQVSFSGDVVLKINLRRAPAPPSRQATRPRSSQIESGPKSNLRPASVSPRSVLAPGMNLDGPSVRSNAKPIDERNPYKP